MKYTFTPASRGNNGVPLVNSEKYKTGEAIVVGSLVLFDGNGELTLFGGGTDAVVEGVALEAAGSKLNYGEPFSSQTTGVVAGRAQEISYAKADRETIFTCRGVNGGTDPVTPLQTHIGEQYGVAVSADGSWYLDIAETTTKICQIVGIIPSQGGQIGLFKVKFLEAVLQTP